MTQTQHIILARNRVLRARKLCPHSDYFASHRLECCRERLAAERDLKLLTRPMAQAILLAGV